MPRRHLQIAILFLWAGIGDLTEMDPPPEPFVEDLGSWCIENTDLLQKDLDEGNHPTLEQHQSYARQVVLPSISKLI